MGAVKASAYSTGFAIPGGCGKASTDVFGVSTIIARWDSHMNIESENSSKTGHLDFWTSSVNFYAADVPRGLNESCAEVLAPNSTLMDNIIYHVYSVPLVTCGGSLDSFENPRTDEILKTISRISSSGDTLFHGSLIVSVKARDLQLREDFSYGIPLVRHLGVAAVVTIIAEYQANIAANGESSTFVAYTPTVLYTCRPTREFTPEAVHYLSDQLSCGLLSDSVPGTRFFVGLLMVVSFLYAVLGSYFVWSRCLLSLLMTFSLVFMFFGYRFEILQSNVAACVVFGVLIPIATSLCIMIVIWFACVRRSYYPPPPSIPSRPNIFARPPIASTSDILSVSRVNFNLDDTEEVGNSRPYQHDASDDYYDAGKVGFDRAGGGGAGVVGSSVNLLSNATNTTMGIGLNMGFDEMGESSPVSVTENRRGCLSFCCGRLRQANAFRLRRFARLPPIIPASFLIASLITGACLPSFQFLRIPEAHLSVFVLLVLVLLILLTIYKNFAFGLSVGVTGLYIALSCFGMLFFPNALLPYVLIDQFLILAWPSARLQTRHVSAHGRNDMIFLVVWLLGSLLVGLITMCMLRFQDSREHARGTTANVTAAASNQTRLAFASAHPPVPTAASRHTGVPFLQRLHLRRGRARSPDLLPLPEPDHEVDAFAVTTHLEHSLLTTAGTAWPPQPFERSYQPAANERRGLLPPPRQRAFQGYGGLTDNTSPLAPMSRVQIAAAASSNLSPLPQLNPFARHANDMEEHADSGAPSHCTSPIGRVVSRPLLEIPPPAYSDIRND
nr:unnamed protein product [Spirometra erinaceieuropaei]